MDISKIEAGKVKLSLEEFGLDDVMKEVFDEFVPIAGLKNPEIKRYL